MQFDDPQELEEDHTKIMRANDPNAADNITLFNYQERVFKLLPSISHMKVHLDKSYACVPPCRHPQASVPAACRRR